MRRALSIVFRPLCHCYYVHKAHGTQGFVLLIDSAIAYRAM